MADGIVTPSYGDWEPLPGLQGKESGTSYRTSDTVVPSYGDVAIPGYGDWEPLPGLEEKEAPKEPKKSLVQKGLEYLAPEGEQLGTTEALTKFQVPERIRRIYAPNVDVEQLTSKLQGLADSERNWLEKLIQKDPREALEEEDKGMWDALLEGRNFSAQLFEKLLGADTKGYYNLSEVMDEEGNIPVEAIQRLNLPRELIAELAVKARSQQLGIPEEKLMAYARNRGLTGSSDLDSLESAAQTLIRNAQKKGIEITPDEAYRIVTNKNATTLAGSMGLIDSGDLGAGEDLKKEFDSSALDEFFMGIPGAVRRELKEAFTDEMVKEKDAEDYAEYYGFSEVLENAIAEAKEKQEPVELLLPNIGGIFGGEIEIEPGDTLEEVKKDFNEEFLKAALGDIEDLGTSSKGAAVGNVASMFLGGGFIKAASKLPKLAKLLNTAKRTKLGKAALYAGGTAGAVGTGIAGTSMGAPTGQQDLYAEMGLKLGGVMTGLGAGVLGGTTLAKAGTRRLQAFWRKGKEVPLTEIQKRLHEVGEENYVKLISSDSYDDLPEDLQAKVSSEDFANFKRSIEEETEAEAKLLSTFGSDILNAKTPSKQAAAVEVFRDMLETDPRLKELIDTISVLKNGVTPESNINMSSLKESMRPYYTGIDSLEKAWDNVLVDLEGKFNNTEELISHIQKNKYFGDLTQTIVDSMVSKVEGGVVSRKDAYFKEAMAIMNNPLRADVEALTSAEKIANSDFLKNHFGTLRKQESIDARDFKLEGIQEAKEGLIFRHREAIDTVSESKLGMPKKDFVDLVTNYPEYMSKVARDMKLPKEIKAFVTEANVLDKETSKLIAKKTKDYYKLKAASLYQNREMLYTRIGEDVSQSVKMRDQLNPQNISDAITKASLPDPQKVAWGKAIEGIKAADELFSAGYFRQIAPRAKEDDVSAVIKGIKYGEEVEEIKDPILRKFYKTYQDENYLMEKVTEIFENSPSPLTAIESLDRLGPRLVTKSNKEKVAILMASLSEEVEGSLNKLGFDAKTQAEFSEVLRRGSSSLGDTEVSVSRPQAIIDAANVARKEIIDDVSIKFKELTGQDLNKLEFMAHFLGRENSYDFANIYGRSLANVAAKRSKGLLAKGWFHTQLFTSDMLGKSMSDKTGAAIYDATVDLHNGVRTAKSLSREVIHNFTKKFLDIDKSTAYQTNDIVKSIVGHEGIKAFISSTSEDGVVTYNKLGDLVKDIFLKNDFSKMRAYEARELLRDGLERRWNSIADERTDTLEGLGLPAVEDQLVNYWYKEGATPSHYESAFKVYELIQKQHADTFKETNNIIRNANAENRHNVQVPEYRWRSDKYIGRKYVTASLEEGEGMFDSRASRWHGIESSSAQSQLQRAQEMKVNEMDNPYRAMSQNIHSKFRDALEIHAKEKINLHSENLIDLGFSDHARVISEYAINHGSIPSIFSVLFRNITRTLEVSNKHPTWAKRVYAHVGLIKNSFIVQPTLAMASLLKAARNTSQGIGWMNAMTKTTKSRKYIPLITPVVDAIKVPLSVAERIIEGTGTDATLAALGREGMTRKGITGSEQLVIKPDETLRQVSMKLVRQQFDNPLTYLQRSADIITSLGVEDSADIRVVRGLSDIPGSMSDNIMIHLKEKYEAALAKDVTKLAEKSFLLIEDHLQKGDNAAALAEIGSTFRLNSNADNIALLNKVKQATNRSLAYKNYAQDLIDSAVGRFGSQANSLGIRLVGRYLPGLQVFYTSRMMVPLGITRAVQKAVTAGGDPEALKAVGAVATNLVSLYGVYYFMDEWLGTDLSDYSPLGATQEDIVGNVREKAPSSVQDVATYALTTALTGGPSVRGTIGRESMAYGTGHTLKATSSLLEYLSMATAGLLAPSNASPMEYDLFERTFGKLSEDYDKWADMPDGYEKDALGRKIANQYRMKTGAAPYKVAQDLLMETGPLQFLKDFMSNPYLYAYATNEYNTTNLFMDVASEEKTGELRKALGSMGIFKDPFQDFSAYLFGIDIDTGRENYLTQLSQRIAYLNRLGVGFSDDTIKRIIERHGEVYDKMWGMERAKDSSMLADDDLRQRYDILKEGGMAP